MANLDNNILLTSSKTIPTYVSIFIFLIISLSVGFLLITYTIPTGNDLVYELSLDLMLSSSDIDTQLINVVYKN